MLWPHSYHVLATFLLHSSIPHLACINSRVPACINLCPQKGAFLFECNHTYLKSQTSAGGALFSCHGYGGLALGQENGTGVPCCASHPPWHSAPSHMTIVTHAAKTEGAIVQQAHGLLIACSRSVTFPQSPPKCKPKCVHLAAEPCMPPQLGSCTDT